ncbi:hypothetical protein ABT317_25100, partial [Streptomyces carpinensis]
MTGTGVPGPSATVPEPPLPGPPALPLLPPPGGVDGSGADGPPVLLGVGSGDEVTGGGLGSTTGPDAPVPGDLGPPVPEALGPAGAEAPGWCEPGEAWGVAEPALAPAVGLP